MVSNNKKSHKSGQHFPEHQVDDEEGITSSNTSTNNVRKVNDHNSDDILDRRIVTAPEKGTILSPLQSPTAPPLTPSRNTRTRRLVAHAPRIVQTFSSPRTTTHSNHSIQQDAMRSTLGSPVKRRHQEFSACRIRNNSGSIGLSMTPSNQRFMQEQERAGMNLNTKHTILSVASGDHQDSWDDDDNFFDRDALEQVFSPPKRKRSEESCDLDCPTLRTVRGSSSFCSASHASGESKSHRSATELRQSQSMRSPLKERRTSNGSARLLSHPAQPVDYRNFFTNTAELLEEPCCKERGSKCAIVQTAAGYEVKLKGVHDSEALCTSNTEDSLKPSASENVDFQRCRSRSVELPHPQTSLIRRGSNSLFLPTAKTPRKARSKTEDESQYSCHKSSFKDARAFSTSGHCCSSKLQAPTPHRWATKTPDPNLRHSECGERPTSAAENGALSSTLGKYNNPKGRPQCPLKAMWNEEECRVNKDTGDDYWEDERIPRRTESEDTLSPASTPFRFTSFPASLPRIQPKGLKSTAMPSAEDLPSQWLNYDCSNIDNGCKETYLEGEKMQSEAADVHSSPGTRSGNSNTQDDLSSLKSDQDDNSLSHGKVVRMAACARQTFEPILEGSGSRSSPAFPTGAVKTEDRPCPSILFQGETEGDHDVAQGDPCSPMHSQDGSGYCDSDPHLAKSVDVSHDSTLSSITASPTPYRPQAKSGHFAPGKTLRSRPLPQLSTPMELDSADLHKVASGCQLHWEDGNDIDVEQEDEVASKKASCTRLNFNSLMSPGDGRAGNKGTKEELDETVIKSKIVLKRTFSHDTQGYDEDHDGSNEMHLQPENNRSGAGMGPRIQFDFGSSSEWPVPSTGHEARPRINTSDNIFGEQTDVSPIRADSAASASSHKSPASFQYEETHSLASPMVSSSSATIRGHADEAKANWGHDDNEKISRVSSSGTNNLFDDGSSPNNKNSSGMSTSLCKDNKDFNSPNSLERRKTKVRPMPDMAAFDSSSSDETQQNSFSSGASAKTACPPTPVRTPAWAMKDNKVKPLSLYRHNSLQATKVLADCSISMTDDLEDNFPVSNVAASKKAGDIDIEDPDMDDDLDPEIEKANFGRGCWHYDTSSGGYNGNAAKNCDPGEDPETSELIVVSFEADFENLGLLGSGAFADVYKARSKSDGRLYAIKRNRRQFRSRRDRDRTMMEVKIMQKLQGQEGKSNSLSQYLIRFVRAWQQDGHFHCQTEICCRENCHDLISVWSCEASLRKYPRFFSLLAEANQGSLKSTVENSVLPESSIWRICHDVVSGLSHMHSNGIVHFDVKPCNILFDPNNEQGCICKIGDFGMAGAIDTEEDGQEGDTAFMAPELLNSCRKKPSADIFSLGLTLYNLAADPSWKLPSEGERFKEIRSKGHQPELPLSRSDNLKNLIQAMITPEQDTRPSATDVLESAPLVRTTGMAPDKFLTAFVKDAQEFERLREKEIALKYQLARDRRTTPTSFLLSSKELVDRMDEVRTPTANTQSLNYMQGGRSVFRK